jgi:hypothetical protein
MRGPLVEEKQTTAENPEQLLAFFFSKRVLRKTACRIKVDGAFDKYVQFSPFMKSKCMQ